MSERRGYRPLTEKELNVVEARLARLAAERAKLAEEGRIALGWAQEDLKTIEAFRRGLRVALGLERAEIRFLDGTRRSLGVRVDEMGSVPGIWRNEAPALPGVATPGQEAGFHRQIQVDAEGVQY